MKIRYIPGTAGKRRAIKQRMSILDNATMALHLNGLISKAQAQAIHKAIAMHAEASFRATIAAKISKRLVVQSPDGGIE